MKELTVEQVGQVAGGRFSLFEAGVVIAASAQGGALIGLLGGLPGSVVGGLVGGMVGGYIVATTNSKP